MSLYNIPFRVGPLHYSLIVVLSDENIERLRRYDPAEVVLDQITGVLGEPWTTLTLKDVLIAYATAQELDTVTALLEQGNVRDAVKLLTRGYQYRPQDGDGMTAYVKV